MKMLAASEIVFSSLKFKNRTPRYIIPVPNLGDDGELLIFPPGHKKAGEPIRKRYPRGVILRNEVDGAIQGAYGDGTDAIAVNDITFEAARSLHAAILCQIGTDPELLTLKQIQDLIVHLETDFHHHDFYPKSRGELLANHKPAIAEMVIPGTMCGYFRVSKETEHRAAWIREAFIFNDGPTEQTYPDGAVIVTDEKHTWGIGCGPFERGFVVWDGVEEKRIQSLSDVFGK